MSELKKLIGSKILEARKAKGLTQTELGELLGVSKVTINGYEAGKQNLTLETLERITKALGVKLRIEF
ncbi:hypothetical protein GCM10028808_10430 [Spirosoma migulaei]